LSVDVDDETNRVYDDYYCHVNPIAQNASPILMMGSLVDGIQVVGRDNWVRSEFYNDFSEPRGIFYVAGAVMSFTAGMATALSMHRSRRTGPYTDEDLRFLGLLTPHLGNRIDLERKLAQAESSRRTLENALEALGAACLVLDDRASVIYCNRPAESVLSSRDGLELTATGNLVAEDIASGDSLRKAIREAIEVSLIRGIRNPQVVQVERPSGKRPYTLFASPCDPGEYVLDRTPAVLVLINDPDARPPSMEEMLMRLYRLTPAEARVAVGLVGGRSPKEIALELGLALNTVRTQVKNILSKTDTRRQSEFVSVVFRTIGRLVR
jgi:DNA-binding CsgD family transcriptional regulator